VVGDRLALGYADYVLSEAGFGADLGFEKFMHIKARFNNLEPDAAVLVATVRAVKSHGGVPTKELDTPNEDAVRKGMENLTHLIGVVREMGLPVVVAINHFPTDTHGEKVIVKQGCEEAGAFAAVESRVFEEGGAGAIELAEAVIKATEGPSPEIKYLYPTNASIQDKVLALAHMVYNADDVSWSPSALRTLRGYEANGWGELPVCMAKTNFSISHQASLKGRPSGYTFEITDVRASVGAGFIYPIAGSIMTMPGLPGAPRALDVDAQGNILNL
jgi:formyltetrahydrofolate synthetase